MTIDLEHEGDAVWVVIASQGEYSDRSEWTVEAYENEAQGRAAVEKYDAEERAKKLPYGHDEITHYLARTPLIRQALNTGEQS